MLVVGILNGETQSGCVSTLELASNMAMEQGLIYTGSLLDGTVYVSHPTKLDSFIFVSRAFVQLDIVKQALSTFASLPHTLSMLESLREKNNRVDEWLHSLSVTANNPDTQHIFRAIEQHILQLRGQI